MFPYVQNFTPQKQKPAISVCGPRQLVVNSKQSSQNMRNGWCRFLTIQRKLIIVSHQWCDLFFFHRLLHSYTRHIERVTRGERDIVPSTQDWGHADVAWGKCASQATQAGVTLSWHPPPPYSTCKQAKFQWFLRKAAKKYDSLFLETQKWHGWNRTAFVILKNLNGSDRTLLSEVSFLTFSCRNGQNVGGRLHSA